MSIDEGRGLSVVEGRGLSVVEGRGLSSVEGAAIPSSLPRVTDLTQPFDCAQDRPWWGDGHGPQSQGPGRAPAGDLRYAAATVNRALLLVPRRRPALRSVVVAAATMTLVAGSGAVVAQPSATPAQPATTEAAARPRPVEPAAGDDDGAPRRFEVGTFLGLDYFGDDIELGNSWAPEQIPGTSFLFGGRAAFIALPDLAPGSSLDPQLGLEVEAKLALSSTGSADDGGRASDLAPVLGWRVHLLARLRSGSAWTPHLVVGLGGETVFTTSPFMADDTDAAFHYGLGVARPLFGRWDLRLDARHGLTAGRIAGVVSTFELHAGLSTGWDLARGRVAPRPDQDTDGDGIRDRVDECPTEPETINEFRDQDGCPDIADRDGDGVMDPDDTCIDEPETINGIDDTDGCPEIDEDGDGRIGSQDACPTVAEDFDKYQDEDGCPEPDNDGDGVPDVADVCPGQPETRNGFEDDDGCPDEVPTAVREFTGTIEGITFATGKAIIRPPSRKTVDRAVALLAEYPSIQIRIEGHTDSRGTRPLNLDLSQRRADAVLRYLVDKGIAETRLTTVGHGPDVPRDSNKTARGRARNRRIEFHIMVQEPIALPTPGVPTTQPTAPATQPTAPATQPTAPATP